MGYTKQLLILGMLIALLVPSELLARPVSYAGGWTFMTRNDANLSRIHLHYSPTASYSVGPSADFLKKDKATITGAHFNYLLKRWNLPDAQANVYLRGGLGMGIRDGNQSVAGWTGMSADWENRRLFLSYSNNFISAYKLSDFSSHKARVGIAPYVAEYDSIHTWLMLQVQHAPSDSSEILVTPLLRFFKGPALVEVGMSSNKQVLTNFIYRF